MAESPSNMNALFCSGAAYPIDDSTASAEAAPPSLLNICCSHFAKSSKKLFFALESVPYCLYEPLLQAVSLHYVPNGEEKFKLLCPLVSHWPSHSLILRELIPNPFDTFSLLHDIRKLYSVVDLCRKQSSCLLYAFQIAIETNAETKLGYMDLTGFPTPDRAVQDWALFCWLHYSYNKLLQPADLYKVNSNARTSLEPNFESINKWMDTNSIPFVAAKLDAMVHNEVTVEALMKSFKISLCPESKIRLFLGKLDIMMVEPEKIGLLLKEVSVEHLKELKLQNNGICSSDMEMYIAPNIQRLTNLTSLDLSYNHLNLTVNGHTCSVMVTMLLHLTNLIRLDLTAVYMKTRLRRLLCDLEQPLQYLRVSACGLTVSDITYLSHSHHVTSLKELDVSQNILSPPTIHNFLRILDSAKDNLLVLNIEDTISFSADFDRIIPCLSKLCNLRYLNVYNVFINHSSLSVLFACLGALPRFKTLRLGMRNKIYSATWENLKNDTHNFQCVFIDYMPEIYKSMRIPFSASGCNNLIDYDSDSDGPDMPDAYD